MVEDEKAPEEDPFAISARDRRLDLRVQPSPHGLEEHTSYTHLIKGDLAPIGRVHVVSLGPFVGEEESRHFLSQMDADSNMGAKRFTEASRRGPFKQSSGRSRIMDRSAHVSYRKRGHALEITISRGVTLYEMDTLIGKLNAHRLGTHGAEIFIIGASKKKLGSLDRIDLDKLRNKILDEVEKRRQVGLLVVDTKEPGILHRGYAHNMTTKEAYRGLLESRTFGLK